LDITVVIRPDER